MSKEQIIKVSKNYKRSVGKITCLNNEVDPNEPFCLSNEANEEVMGSGFFVRCTSLYLNRELSHNRYMVTNAHVIEGCSTKRISINFPHLGTVNIWGTVILACKALDFAIIEVVEEQNEHLEKEIGKNFTEVFATIPYVKMSSKPVNTNTEIAQDILAIGFPLDSNDSHISAGVISGKHEHYLQINGSINSGNSGGPLFDASGNCIGICAASFQDSDGITLAIEFHAVAQMLEHYWDKTSLVAYPPSLGIMTKKLIDSYAVTQLKDETIKGALVSEVFEENCFRNQLKKGDVLLSIGDQSYEFSIDRAGNVNVPYQHDKVQFNSLNVLMLLDAQTTFVRVYSKGKRKTVIFKMKALNNRVQNVMPSLEPIACFTCGGLIFTQLTRNHMEEVPEDVDPNVVNFFTQTRGSKQAVVISSYCLPCSVIEQGYNIKKLTIVKSINKKKITTVEELKTKLLECLNKFEKFPNKITCRYIRMETQSETWYVDVAKFYETEKLLNSTPAYPREYSLIHNYNKKRKVS